MRIYDIIYKKRNGGKLTREEIQFFVDGFTDGSIADYQASAFLMASFLRGLDAGETAILTEAMRDSGDNLDLKSVPGIKVDKHSTGGVGDGISLVLAPLVAACGVPVPMMSGRGLGHTGGTLDKLESIPGFSTQVQEAQAIEQLKRIGCVMMGQTARLAPADKKMYALRDVTATVDCVPLITASILSKKLAEGCDALVLDVKTGSGAFMQEKKDAIKLAQSMVSIGKKCRKKMVALITDMNEPLGKAVGNSLETLQAVEILSGKEEPATRDYIEINDALGGWMLVLGGKARTQGEGAAKIKEARKNGAGLAKFQELVTIQGGPSDFCSDPLKHLPKAPKIKQILAPQKGYVVKLDARATGVAAVLLGAGREKQDSKVDLSAGILLHKKQGGSVERGESIAEFHYADDAKFAAAERTFMGGVKIAKIRPRANALIYKIIR